MPFGCLVFTLYCQNTEDDGKVYFILSLPLSLLLFQVKLFSHRTQTLVYQPTEIIPIYSFHETLIFSSSTTAPNAFHVSYSFLLFHEHTHTHIHTSSVWIMLMLVNNGHPFRQSQSRRENCERKMGTPEQFACNSFFPSSFLQFIGGQRGNVCCSGAL